MNNTEYGLRLGPALRGISATWYLIISSREKDGESITPSLLHLLGHVMNGYGGQL
jgi:hypothetical protein